MYSSWQRNQEVAGAVATAAIAGVAGAIRSALVADAQNVTAAGAVAIPVSEALVCVISQAPFCGARPALSQLA